MAPLYSNCLLELYSPLDAYNVEVKEYLTIEITGTYSEYIDAHPHVFAYFTELSYTNSFS